MNKRKLLIPVAAFLAGIAFSAPTFSNLTPPPAKTITKYVDIPGPVQVVNRDVPGPSVNVTPQSCLEALDHATEGFGIASSILSGVSDGLTAATTFDQPGVEAGLVRMNAGNEKLAELAPKWTSAREACRGE